MKNFYCCCRPLIKKEDVCTEAININKITDNSDIFNREIKSKVNTDNTNNPNNTNNQPQTTNYFGNKIRQQDSRDSVSGDLNKSASFLSINSNNGDNITKPKIKMSEILKNKIIAKKEKLEELEKLNSINSKNHAYSRNNVNCFDDNSSLSFKNKSFMKDNFDRTPSNKSQVNKAKWLIDDTDIANNSKVTRSFNDYDVQFAPTVILEEIEGNILNNKLLLINAQGLVNGERKEKDGIAFFGTSLKKDDKIVNDFVLNISNDDSELGLFTFLIFYKKENNKYYLRAYRDKQNVGILSKVIIKIENEIVIVTNELIAIGDKYFLINIIDERVLEIKKLSSKSSPGEKVFMFDPNEKMIVTIGRGINCDLSYPSDKSFSRIHASLIFDSDINLWKIKDGDGNKKPSSNGIWLVASHSYEITNETIFKIGRATLKISLRS